MNFVAILAGGVGSRTGNLDKPKQYLDLVGKPAIVHTLETFLVMIEFERAIVLCLLTWVESTRDILWKAFRDGGGADVVADGETRNETVTCAVCTSRPRAARVMGASSARTIPCDRHRPKQFSGKRAAVFGRNPSCRICGG